LVVLAACSGDADPVSSPSPSPALETFAVPAGSRPHDVAVAPAGTVWYTAQSSGELGRLDARTRRVTEVALGTGSSPHGVVIGPDGAPWVTDTGLNAVVRVDPVSGEVKRFPSPRPNVGMHTAVFDQAGRLWFTGNAGYYGRLSVADGRIEVFEAPGGAGPYGITVVPGGDVYYASLAQSHVVRVDPVSGSVVSVLTPPTPGQGARRVWADSQGRVWVSEWNAGQVAVYDPAGGGSGSWREWKLPGPRPQAYAVYVDERDQVWLSDFGANALVRFDPGTEQFESFPLPDDAASVRQLLGRPGEVWGAESAVDKLVVVRR
jgi:virginiamycin B lyase